MKAFKGFDKDLKCRDYQFARWKVREGVNTSHEPRFRPQPTAEEMPDRDMPNAHCLEDGRIRWRIENANLVALGAWLAIGLLVLCAIGEMNGW